MNVYLVLDDSDYPAKVDSVFKNREDAQNYANTLKDYIVEEFEVIE
jgi:uncharacterized protein YfcZ (UPF0381/DUF406 family)